MQIREFFIDKQAGFPLYLLLFVTFFALYIPDITSQGAYRERTISGIVTDERGEPLPGAHVKEIPVREGQSVASVATDLNGHFSLTIGEDIGQLEVSFIGYITQVVSLSQAGSYQVRLLPSEELLDEVVVTGYQTLSRERVTGAFAKIGTEKLELKRPHSLSSLLEGEVAGYNRGLIRGTTSMNGMTTPLYVIDGFPVENTRYNANGSLIENLPELNIEDIDNITVLKDAAAASIYGARAANGVIVITTKKAERGRTRISLSSTLAVTPYNYYTGNLADAATMIDIEREWALNNPNLQGDNAAAYAASILSRAVYPSDGIRTLLKGYAGQLPQAEVEATLNELASQGYRYYDELERYAKRDAMSQQYNLSLSKGTEGNLFKASVTYRHNTASDIHTGSESLGLNIVNSTRINDFIQLELGSWLNHGSGITQTYSPLSPGYSYQPYNNLMNTDGTHFTSRVEERTSESYQSTLAQYGLYNMDITPLDEIGLNHRKNRDLSSRTFARLAIQLTPWLRYTPQFQYEYGSYRSSQLNDKNSISVRSRVNSFASANGQGGVTYNLPYGHIYQTDDQVTQAYNFRQQLDFSRNFGELHDLVAILGSETRHMKVESTGNNLYNYDPEMLSYTAVNGNALSSLSTILGGNSWSNSNMTTRRELVNRFVSFYGNAGYTYDSRYNATASLRWDRSNLWGTNSRYQNKPLWSVGAGWNIFRESFFEVEQVNALKMRFSYGIGGNIAKDAAPYMTAHYSNNYNVGGLYGSVSTRPNPELSWEKTTTTNIGIDFALFDNRLVGSIDYYNKYGEDLLANTMGVPTEGFGYNTYKINNGEMRNRGLELSLSGDLIRTRDFNWNASLLAARNKNEVTYVNVEAPVYILQLDYPEAYPIVGNPYNAIYAYQWAGLNGNGLPQVKDAEGNATTANPSTLDAIDFAGSTVPSLSGSFGSILRYKQVELSFLLVYEYGHKRRNTFLPTLGSSWSGAVGSYITSLGGAVNKDIANRWREPGDEAHTDIPAVVFAESPNYLYDSGMIYSYADHNVLDMSNIRLSNLSLAYRLPNTLTRKLQLHGARLQFNVENAFTFAKSRDAKYLMGGYASPTFVGGLTLDF